MLSNEISSDLGEFISDAFLRDWGALACQAGLIAGSGQGGIHWSGAWGL